MLQDHRKRKRAGLDVAIAGAVKHRLDDADFQTTLRAPRLRTPMKSIR